MSDSYQLTDDDVAVVLQAIREGRVRGLDDEPYDAEAWDEEAAREWLERTHTPSHARYMVTTLRAGKRIKSRPTPPTTDLAIRALARRIAQLERTVDALRERLLDQA
jgi:hypothetical protein